MKRGTTFLFYSILVLILFALVVTVVAYIQQIPSNGHGADKVFISLKGSDMLLQDAIDNKLLIGTNLNGSNVVSPIPNPGHLGSNILIEVSNVDKTLQQAINFGTLCSNSSSLSYSQSAPNPGHLGSEILITNFSGSEKTLQQAINDKEFCSCGNNICENSSNVNNYGENCSICSVDCGSCAIVTCPQVSEIVTACNFGGACYVQVTFGSRPVDSVSYGTYNPCPPANAGTGIVGSATKTCNAGGVWSAVTNNLHLQNNLCSPYPPYNPL